MLHLWLPVPLEFRQVVGRGQNVRKTGDRAPDARLGEQGDALQPPMGEPCRFIGWAGFQLCVREGQGLVSGRRSRFLVGFWRRGFVPVKDKGTGRAGNLLMDSKKNH